MRKNNYLIDNRTSEDFIAEMKSLASSYAPEWHFDTTDPDIASTISILYSKQLAENVKRINYTIDRYHTEFINLLDITAHSARPSESIVLMDLAADTIEGAEVPAGTKLMSSPMMTSIDGSAIIDETVEDSIVFETTNDVYVTSAYIKDAFLVDREDCSIVPILGEFSAPEYLYPYEEHEVIDEDTIAEEIGENPDNNELITIIPEDDAPIIETSIDPFDNGIKPFVLFGESNGIQKNICLIYHEYILGTTDNDIYISLSGNEDLVKSIVNGERHFSYPYNGSLVPVENVRLLEDGKTFLLRKEHESELQKIAGRVVALIAIESNDGVIVDEVVDSIKLSAHGTPVTPEFVGDDTTDMDASNFAPFGDTLQLYKEIYIGHDDYFAKPDARVNLKFDLAFEEHMISLTVEEEEAMLKVIKRKPKDTPSTAPAEVFADIVSIEYYNGIGWKRLDTDSDVSRIFAGGNYVKEMNISFRCPTDWKPTTIGAFDGRMLRIQVLNANNCYLRPSLHHFPRIMNMQISFDYQGRDYVPQFLSVIAGTRKYNLSDSVREKKPISVFKSTGHSRDALYLGLSKRPARGPVTMFFKLNEESRYEGISISYEYSTINGFKRLRVYDETGKLSHSGLFFFVPPADWAARTVEGKTDYWLRIVRNNVEEDDNKENLPKVSSIQMNGVRVRNIDTLDEVDLFVDELKPNMSFPLNINNILDVEVWVNETGQFSQNQMLELINDKSKYMAEYNVSGEISAIYEKWTEAEALDSNAPFHSYVLDRLESVIHFGDGITTDLPRVINGIGIKVRPRVSVGALANVDSNMINSSVRNMIYIGNISNPIGAYGGSSTESLEKALNRGANIISGRKRLVSINDYTKEILGFSDTINQVGIVVGADPNNKPRVDGVSFILLMRGYDEGSYSFHKVADSLKKHLLSRCEVTFHEDEIFLTEPVFVELDVTLWCENIPVDIQFAVTKELNEMFAKYFNPLSDSGPGWKIGTMPAPEQIRLKISAMTNKIVVDNITILARYHDHEGDHEVDLEELEVTPFMIVKNGTHKVQE